MKLSEKLSKIQEEFKAKKSRFNSFGKYNFRSAEDILEALKPFNKKYDVYFTISESIVETSPLPIISSTASISNGEESIIATAIVGVDLNQKGMQVPQQFGSASSYAKKYSLGNLLLIDDTQDSDATNSHDKTEKAWLNKNTPEFKKAVDFLKGGGNISKIQEKYKMSTDVKAELSKIN